MDHVVTKNLNKSGIKSEMFENNMDKTCAGFSENISAGGKCQVCEAQWPLVRSYPHRVSLTSSPGPNVCRWD